MKDKMKLLILYSGIAFQFLLVLSLIIFDGYLLFTTKSLDEGITGAIIGLTTGIGLNNIVSNMLETGEDKKE